MRFSLANIFCLIVLSISLSLSGAFAQSSSEIKGNGQTAGATGTADLTVNGATNHATVTVSVLKAASVKEDGLTREEETSHRFDFADGSSFTTTETITMTPTSTPGMYNMFAISS